MRIFTDCSEKSLILSDYTNIDCTDYGEKLSSKDSLLCERQDNDSEDDSQTVTKLFLGSFVKFNDAVPVEAVGCVLTASLEFLSLPSGSSLSRTF